MVEHTAREFWQVVVVREIKDVGAVKGQDAPASSPGIDRVSPRRSIGLIGRHSSQRFGEGIRSKVLEVLP